MMLVKLVMLVFLNIFSNIQSFQFIDFIAKSDFELKFEHMDVVDCNTNYIKACTVKSFKFNRTTIAFNVTFINTVDLGEEIQLLVQAYKFESNEYRSLPLRFQVDLCVAFDRNLGGMRDIFRQNGNQDICPTKKDVVYQIKNFSPNQRIFPPNISRGHYMVEVTALCKDQVLYAIHAYATIYKEAVKKETPLKSSEN